MLHEVIFWAAFLGSMTFGVAACRANKNALYFFFLMMILFTGIEHGSINFFSREYYRGATRGFEFHGSFLCAVVLAITMLLQTEQYKIRWFVPLTIPTLCFVCVGVISWITITSIFGYETVNPHQLQSFDAYTPTYPSLEIGLYPAFEIAKILCGFFVFWVTINIFTHQNMIRIVLVAFCIAILYFTCFALIQRYVFGIYRASAFGDTNVLNSYIGMIGVFLIPFAFQTKKPSTSILLWMFIGLSFICIILTVSRSSLAGFVLAGGLVGLFSLTRFMSLRNVALPSFCAFIGVLLLIRASNTLIERFFYAEPIDVSLEGRELYIKEAISMARDHFFGIGPNNFSAFVSFQYAQEIDPNLSSGALAHNVWYLTLGEYGWPGLIAFMILWIRFYQILLSSLFNKKLTQNPVIYATLLGILASSIVLQFQDYYHFAYRITPIFFLTQIIMGLTVKIYLIGREMQSRG